jgi:hypothetical protein
MLCVVSLQKPGAPDLRSGHLGPGLLIGPTMLLVTADVLLANRRGFEVVIGPVTAGQGPVEVSRARPFPDGRVSVVRLKGYEKTVALGHAQLLGPSSYPGRAARLDLLVESVAGGAVAGQGPWGVYAPMVPEQIRWLPDDRWLSATQNAIGPELPPVEMVVPPRLFRPWLCRVSPWWDPDGPSPSFVD